MNVWTSSMRLLLDGAALPSTYVYLPVYAQILAALYAPFAAAGITSVLLASYIVHLPVIMAYLYAPKMMVNLVPEQSTVAPLAIILAPVTIFYLFYGTNNIVMFAFFLGAICCIKQQRWFWSGFLAFLSCYKFLLIPTLLVLLAILHRRCRLNDLKRFYFGGLVSLLPSLLYYVYFPSVLLRELTNMGAIGVHCNHIETFHPLHLFASIEGFERWFIDGHIWFILAVAGTSLAMMLYFSGKLTTLQALGMSAGFVALFSLEPFRLEPTIGLLWLDAVHRRDMRVQTAVLVVIFVHALAWFPNANPAFLTLSPDLPSRLWSGRGLVLGTALIGLLTTLLLSENRDDFLDGILIGQRRKRQ
jgi:hypothetical protein